MGGVRSIKRSGGCRLRLEQHREGGSALDCVEEVDESSRIGMFVRASFQSRILVLLLLLQVKKVSKLRCSQVLRRIPQVLVVPIHEGPGVE